MIFCAVAINRENHWRAVTFAVVAVCWISAARFPVKCAVTTDEPRRATVLFWLTVVATSAGFISMTTDVIALFDRGVNRRTVNRL
ncbi:hypothetical protein [Lentzea flava]|uniref:Uncharacterized protein n=1 Tax=Lentzea flava TaxID=103732 RepID=A0ABQ2UJM2_9PSEU|nr:hypothetical protein [Lentzea flava]MCP2199048.1 hypothetical protein [Lentzea flava]GGU34865.1 hypothetical protein GCM10010178_29000 [Lentzea flava]